MRKQFLLMLILCLTASLTWAERIDVATARKVAESVARREGATGGLRSASELPLVYAAAPGQSGSALRSGQMEGAADYFVFNFPGGKGFAIVAGDDRVRPVLGYSDEGNFDPDNLPENLRGMLAYYQKQITWANDKGIEPTPEIAAEWSRYMSGTALRATGGKVLLETAKWGQNQPYYNKTPLFYNGEHTPTGCVATAMAIVMKYHGYPTETVTNGVTSYTVTVTDKPVTYPVEYAPYQWENMPLVYREGSYTDEQAEQVAALMWNIGANLQMRYAPRGSEAYTIYAAHVFSEVFGYSPSIRYLRKDAYRWEEWKTMLRNELDAGHPVIYDGSSISDNYGHAFICDGYSADGTFHINWGWEGSYNGNFILSVLDQNGDGNGYAENQGMLLHIRPEQSGEKYYIRPCLTEAKYSLTNNTANVYFFAEYYALYDHDFYIELGIVNQDGSISITPTSSPIAMKGINLKEGSYYPYDGNRTLTLSAPLSDGQRVTLLCSADGVNWEVMPALETVPIGIGNDGVIGSTPDEPNDPVQPLNAGLYRNKFDGKYLHVSGLDATQNNHNNTEYITYSFSNVTGNAILRYTIANYNDWKGHLAIYQGESYDIYKGGQGTPVTITPEGTFDIEIPQEKIMNYYYLNFLKIYSDRAGELSYDIQVYSQSSTFPAFEQEGNKMYFIDKITGTWDKRPIRGAVNQEIPFTVTFSDIPDILTDKKMTLEISITGLTKDQILLFDVSGKAIALENMSESEKWIGANIAVNKLTNNTPYTFKLKGNKATPENAFISISATPKTVDGQSIPLKMSSNEIIINPTESVTYTIQANLTDLRFTDNTETVVEAGKQGSYVILECNKTGYRLPQSITVTMAGKPLTVGKDYTYNSQNGQIYISQSVTSDIEITAKAEPIPVTTYKVSAMTLLYINASNLPAGGVSIKAGEGFTVKLIADEGYLLPDEVTVKNDNDAALAADTEYTYTTDADRKNGEIKINAVNSNLKIYAIAVRKPQTFTITGKLTNLTADKDIVKGVSVKEKEVFEFTLQPATDYRLPDDITVTPSTIQYSYDKQTGKVVIEKVTEDIAITATAIDDHHFNVILKPGEGVVATPSAIEQLFTVGDQATFNVKFTAAEGYTYDGSVTVKMGDNTLASGTDYTYDKQTGKFVLQKGINATLTISTAKAVKNAYPVTATLEHLTSDLATDAKTAHGDKLSVKLTPDEGYNLPETIEVTMANTALTAGEGYTYNKADSTVTIERVTGAVTIRATAVLKQHKVTLHLENLTTNFTAGEVGHGQVLEMQLTALEGYELPKTITVTMGGKAFADYTYKNGWFQIAAGKVTGAVEITAAASKIYPVQKTTEGVQINGVENVAEGETFTATLSAAEGYKLPNRIIVLMNGQPLDAEAYSYDNKTGAIKIPNVSGTITIVANGVKKGNFEVVLTLTNLTSDPASFGPQAADTKIELTLKPSSGYELPGSIAVKMGDTTLAAGTDYVYDRSTGKFTLEKITGTLVITANGSRIPEPEPEPIPTPTPTTYTVTLPVVEGATIAAIGSTTIEEGSSLSFTVEVKAGYNADNVVVKANGTTLTPDANGRYTIANIHSNVVVTVSGIVKGDNPTANEAINSDELRVWAANGSLHIQTPAADTAYIVTFDGRVYKTLSLSAGEYTEAMPQGSYIIYIGKQSYKLKF